MSQKRLLIIVIAVLAIGNIFIAAFIIDAFFLSYRDVVFNVAGHEWRVKYRPRPSDDPLAFLYLDGELVEKLCERSGVAIDTVFAHPHDNSLVISCERRPPGHYWASRNVSDGKIAVLYYYVGDCYYKTLEQYKFSFVEGNPRLFDISKGTPFDVSDKWRIKNLADHESSFPAYITTI